MKKIGVLMALVVLSCNLCLCESSSRDQNTEKVLIAGITLGAIAGGLKGLVAFLKVILRFMKRRYTLKTKRKINDLFSKLFESPRKCRRVLGALMDDVDKKFQKRRVTEVQYQLLKSEITEKLRQLRDIQEKNESTPEVRLLCKKIKQKDVGKDIARIDKRSRGLVGVSTGDKIKLESDGKSIDLVAKQSYKEDVNLKIVRIDKKARERLAAAEGSFVSVKPSTLNKINDAKKEASGYLKSVENLIKEQNRVLTQRINQESRELKSLKTKILDQRKKLIRKEEGGSEQELEKLRTEHERIEEEIEKEKASLDQQCFNINKNIREAVDKKDTLLRDEARTLGMVYICDIASRLDSLKLDYIPSGEWYSNRDWEVKIGNNKSSVVAKLSAKTKFGSIERAKFFVSLFWSQGYTRGMGLAEECTLESIQPEIDIIVNRANKNKLFYSRVYASPSDWSRQAKTFCENFLDKRVSIYLVDLRSNEITYNSDDEKTKRFAKIFDPKATETPKNLRKRVIEIAKEKEGDVELVDIVREFAFAAESVYHMFDEMVAGGLAKWIEKGKRILIPFLK